MREGWGNAILRLAAAPTIPAKGETRKNLPIEGYQERFASLFGTTVDNSRHNVGGVDEFVVTEPLNLLDAMLGGCGGEETLSVGGKRSSSNVDGGFDEIGTCFGLAKSQSGR